MQLCIIRFVRWHFAAENNKKTTTCDFRSSSSSLVKVSSFKEFCKFWNNRMAPGHGCMTDAHYLPISYVRHIVVVVEPYWFPSFLIQFHQLLAVKIRMIVWFFESLSVRACETQISSFLTSQMQILLLCENGSLQSLEQLFDVNSSIITLIWSLSTSVPWSEHWALFNITFLSQNF